MDTPREDILKSEIRYGTIKCFWQINDDQYSEPTRLTPDCSISVSAFDKNIILKFRAKSKGIMPRSIRIKDKIIRDRVARWVKEQREKMGIDIPEMAEKLGIDAKILENIENQSTISATSLLKIQAYFHFDPYLFLDKK